MYLKEIDLKEKRNSRGGWEEGQIRYGVLARTLCGDRHNSEVPPQMIHPSVHHVNILHGTLGTCQAPTQRDWFSSPHRGKQFAGRAS